MNLELNKCSAIILAGGFSRRMGRPKAMLPINGKPMIYHLVENLESIFQSVIVSVRQFDENYNSFNCVEDIIPGEGPLVGVVSALAKTKTLWNLVVPCDMPYVEMELLTKLSSKSTKKDVIIPIFKNGKTSPFPGFYKKNLEKSIVNHLSNGKRSMMQFLNSVKTEKVNVSSLDEPLNLNYFDDYKRFVETLSVQNNFNEQFI